VFPVFPALLHIEKEAIAAIIVKPMALRRAKLQESPLALRAVPAMILAKLGEGPPEQIQLEPAHLLIPHAIGPQFVEVESRQGLLIILLRQLPDPGWRSVQGKRLQSDRTDRVVRTVVPPHLVDRQESDEAEPAVRRPVNQLPQRGHVTDPQIVLPPEREHRHENAGDAFLVVARGRIKHVRTADYRSNERPC